MSRRNKKTGSVGSIYSFAITWLILSMFFPVFRIFGIIACLLMSIGVAVVVSKVIAASRRRKAEKEAAEAAAACMKAEQAPSTVEKKSYGPEVDPIIEEGNRALSEMGRLYMSIKEPDVRQKINELMRITDKIVQDAIDDPADIPQIKKFMSYYLPTTIKLLNSYDRMSAQGIEGENLNKSMKSINEMLDSVIVAYKKRLDSLFENQALDIETDIDVMNKMLAREGLSGEKDFNIK